MATKFQWQLSSNGNNVPTALKFRWQQKFQWQKKFQWQQKFQWYLSSNGNQKISQGFDSYVTWACFAERNKQEKYSQDVLVVLVYDCLPLGIQLA